MKKIAISSEGPTLDDMVDPRFGRASGFVLCDVDTMATEYISNGASCARAQGAGIAAAELLSASGAGAVLTGVIGPKAFDALQRAGIAMYQELSGMTVHAAIDKFKSGALRPATASNR